MTRFEISAGKRTWDHFNWLPDVSCAGFILPNTTLMIALKRELNLITLTAFIFDIHEGAQKMLDLIEEPSINDPITLESMAMVTWEPGMKNPKTKQMNGPISNGALSGAFWGLLFSRIFFIPSFGMAVGAAMGSLDGKFSGYGIDRNFLYDISNKVTEGTSALFLIGTDVQVEKIDQAAKQEGLVYESISAKLSDEQEKQLRQDFGAE